MNEFEIKVRDIIKENVELLKDISTIDKEEDLFLYGMDSISAIKIIVAVEQEFNFNFDDDDIVIESVHTVQKILNYIESKIS